MSRTCEFKEHQRLVHGETAKPCRAAPKWIKQSALLPRHHARHGTEGLFGLCTRHRNKARGW